VGTLGLEDNGDSLVAIARKGWALSPKLLTEGNGSGRRKNVKNGIVSVVCGP